MRSKGSGPVRGQLPLPGGTPKNLHTQARRPFNIKKKQLTTHTHNVCNPIEELKTNKHHMLGNHEYVALVTICKEEMLGWMQVLIAADWYASYFKTSKCTGPVEIEMHS